MKLYCVHNWEERSCGSYLDCYRECNRCGTRWEPIAQRKLSSSWWDIECTTGVYGKEPKVVIAKS